MLHLAEASGVPWADRGSAEVGKARKLLVCLRLKCETAMLAQSTAGARERIFQAFDERFSTLSSDACSQESEQSSVWCEHVIQDRLFLCILKSPRSLSPVQTYTPFLLLYLKHLQRVKGNSCVGNLGLQPWTSDRIWKSRAAFNQSGFRENRLQLLARMWE